MIKFQYRLIIFVIFSAYFGQLVGTAVSAQSAPPSLTAAATYTFGQAIRFHLDGETAVPAQSAALHIQANGLLMPLVIEKTVSTGNIIQLEHLHDLKENPIWPFATLTFWWELQLESGERLTTPEQSMVYEDTQFVWQALEKGGVTVHWTGNDPALGELALEIVSESQAQLQSFLPPFADQSIRLYVYPSSADLRTMLRLANYDSAEPHSLPELGVLLVTAVNTRTAATDLRKSIPHELMHHRLAQLAGDRYAALPLWFNEGMSTWMEAIPDPNVATVLQTAVADQTTFSFSQLCAAFPTSGREKMLAIAQSISLVATIHTQFGQQALRDLAVAYAEGEGCETAVVKITGQPIDAFEQAWLQAQVDKTPASQFWVENGLWFILILFGVIFMGLLVWKV